jgi:hypothetical protein
MLGVPLVPIPRAAMVGLAVLSCTMASAVAMLAKPAPASFPIAVAKRDGYAVAAPITCSLYAPCDYRVHPVGAMTE